MIYSTISDTIILFTAHYLGGVTIMTDIDIMEWIHEEEDDDQITWFVALIIACMIIIITIWDFIVGIPKAIANWFVTDPVKDNMMSVVDQPKQLLPETDKQVFESAFFRFIERITNIQPTYIVEIMIVVFVLIMVAYLQINHLWPF